MNKTDSAARSTRGPATTRSPAPTARYSCDAIHKRGKCHRRFVRRRGSCTGPRDDGRHGHNELLGGHGSDTIHAGPGAT